MEFLQTLLGLTDLRALFLYFLIFTPVELLIPAHREKKILRPGIALDLMHFVFSGIIIRVGLVLVVAAAVAAGDWVTPEAVSTWAASQPLWLQVLLCIVIADLGFYAAHRLMHEVPWLWNFHAIHHSSEQLDWLASFRVHPVDQVIVKGASLVPVFALGFSTEAIGIASFIYGWQALLIHSNVRTASGKLKWLVATPEFHHWHHAREAAAHNKNYSGQLPLWDMVFGTLHLPARLPEGYGVEEPIPGTYVDQITYPFKARATAAGNTLQDEPGSSVSRSPASQGR